MILKKWNGALLVGISLALGVAGGYWFEHQRMSGVPGTAPEQSLNSPDERKALYWYDPMYPQQKFDKPGKSPFMDMQLVPQYAAGVSVERLRLLYERDKGTWPRLEWVR